MNVYFWSGLFAGMAITALSMGKLFDTGLRYSQLLRDRFRDYLNNIDGYPMAFCRSCGTFVSTDPGLRYIDECMGNRPCLIACTIVWDGGVVEAYGPRCRFCDEMIQAGSGEGGKDEEE